MASSTSLPAIGNPPQAAVAEKLDPQDQRLTASAASPLRYTATLTVLTYLVAMFIDGFSIPLLRHFSPFFTAAIQTTLILITMLPALYLLMFRPMKGYIERQEAARAELETRVAERTRELAYANQGVLESLETLEQVHRDTKLLGELVELLQASRTAAEAEDMLRRFGHKLFPSLDGSIYLYRSSRNVLERAAWWGDDAASPIMFTPEDCWALRRGRQHLADQDVTNPRCRHLRQLPEMGTALCMPMMAQGETTGVLVLHRSSPVDSVGDDTGPRPPFISERNRLLAQLAVEQIALAIANLQLREKLRDQAIRDPLTSMFNRRYFEETAERELRRAEQTGSGAGCIMLDIDHFKRLNDTRGHEAGDVTLRRIGLLLQGKTRVEDIACRYGGEEFVLLLPGADRETLVARANQIREAMREMDLRFHGEVLGPVTVSAGVALFPEHGRTVAELIEAADRALYQAKQAGRDRVIVAS